MKDIHNHILFGIDDGSKTIEESIHIIQQAAQHGYTDLILTPHYRNSLNYVADNRQKKEIFMKLVREVQEMGINIRLYLGNEITLDGNLFDCLKDEKIQTLCESRYILIELPFHSRFAGVHDLIFQIRSRGMIPIIAHPERYEYYSDLEELKTMVEEGALFQCNIGSLYRKYGKSVQEKMEQLLKHHMVHFIGSDVHHEGQTSYSRIGRVQEKIQKFTKSKSMVLDLVDKNIEKVIRNEVVEPYKIKNPNWFMGILNR